MSGPDFAALELDDSCPDCVDWALSYAAVGMRVFPVDARKKPLVKWSEGATIDSEVIRGWWATWRGADIAWAVPDGVLVIDCDCSGSSRGIRDFERLAGIAVGDVETPTATSPTGGRHLFYRTDGRLYKNWARFLPGASIDTRTIGGYVVLPSPGNGREWLKPLSMPMASAPDWVPVARPDEPGKKPGEARPYAGETPYGFAMVAAALRDIPATEEGTQEPTLHRWCFTLGGLVAGGMLEYEPTLQMLIAAAERMPTYRPNEPWKNLGKKVVRSMRIGMEQPIAEPPDYPASVDVDAETEREIFKEMGWPWPPGSGDSPRPNGADPSAGMEQKSGGSDGSSKDKGGAAPGAAPPDDGSPLPLFPTLEPQAPYPVTALGPLAEGAAMIAEQIQTTECVAGNSVLAVASLVAQALADIEMPIGSRGQSRPLSLYFATVVLSGDRKSSTDVEALFPVRQREDDLFQGYEEALKAWRVAHRAWQSQVRSIERKSKLTLAQRIAEIKAAGPEPEAPIRPAFLIPDLTTEGLARRWQKLPASIGLFSAEGGQLLGGFGFSIDHRLATAASLSLLWDAGRMRRLRAGEEELTDLRGRRLAMHIMVQPKAAVGFLGDEVLRDQGLLSRLLLAAPPSLAGNRLFKETDGAAVLEEYSQLILAVLKVWPSDLREVRPRLLRLTATARTLWIRFYNKVERDQGAKGVLAGLQEIANKAPEQAARIAGVLAIVASPGATEVDDEAMKNGVALATWYLDEAVRLAGAVNASPGLRDAQAMLDWLQSERRTTITVREAQRFGPNRLRQKALIEAAFRELTGHFWLRQDPRNKRRWLVTPEPTE
jgi:hypothetical protein